MLACNYQAKNREPACLPTHPTITYERKDLEHWIEKNGSCPITRKEVTMYDCKFDITTFVRIKKILQTILNDQQKFALFNEKEQTGLKYLLENYSRYS